MQTVCYIGQGKYEEADSAISEALEKDDTNATSLVNAIALSAHVNKSSEVGSIFHSSCPDGYLRALLNLLFHSLTFLRDGEPIFNAVERESRKLVVHQTIRRRRERI